MAIEQLEQWHDFYLTIGAGAGALLGATFVVATLSANVENRTIGIRGFITPTAVHLGSVFTVSIVLLMPMLTALLAAAFFGVGGLAGVIYAIIVCVRIYKMPIDWADRFWYAAFPVLNYSAIAVSGVLIGMNNAFGVDLLGIVMVTLTITGIRNAWDMATFMVMRDQSTAPKPDLPPEQISPESTR